MRVRNSAYAKDTTDTYTCTYILPTFIISREISIEHPSVGLASLAQLYDFVARAYVAMSRAYVAMSTAIAMCNHLTRKMVPITGRARSFLLFRCFQKQNREEGETE